jgi:hypothetical protein
MNDALRSWLPLYLGTGLVLTIAAITFVGLFLALARLAGPQLTQAPGRWLRWSWMLLAVALALPALGRWMLPARGTSAPMEIWQAGAGRADWGPAPLHLRLEWAAAPAGAPEAASPAHWTLGSKPQLVALGLLATGLLAGALLLLARQRRLRRFCQQLPLIRRLGRVRLAAGAQGSIPFAAHAGGLAYIVVPIDLLADSARLRLVIAHEVQHHRRGDLLAARMFAWLRVLFFWAPLVGRWERAIAELQDLACDRAVLGRRWVSPRDYGRCLLWAAEAARAGTLAPVGHVGLARGMASGAAGTLKRRILMMKAGTGTSRRANLVAAALGLAALGAVAGSAWAVQAAVADRKVTREQLAAVANRIQQRSGFTVLADDRIVNAFNSRLANPDWREYTRKGLERMPNYRSMIEDTLKRRSLPVQLTAMVLSESAFDNEARPNRPPEVQAAGVWQIIPGSARKLGLTVSPVLDERLEPRRATEAAAQYLTELHAAFGGDWALAIAAYNGGRKTIQNVIGASSGAAARDKVLASNTEFGKYLASVMISMLIIEDPSLLN